MAQRGSQQEVDHPEYDPIKDPNVDIFEKMELMDPQDVSSVTVYRYNDEGVAYRINEKITSPISFGAFERKFGNGMYQIRVNRAGGGGLITRADNVLIGPVSTSSSRPSDDNNGNVRRHPESSLRDLLDERDEIHKREMSALRREYEARAETERKDMEVRSLRDDVKNLSSDLQRMMNNSQKSAEPSLMDTLLVEMLKKSMERADAPPVKQEDPLNQFVKVKDIVESMSGGGDWKAEAVKSVGEVVAAAASTVGEVASANLELRKQALDATERESQAKLEIERQRAGLNVNNLANTGGMMTQTRTNAESAPSDEMTDDEMLQEGMEVFIEAMIDTAKAGELDPSEILSVSIRSVYELYPADLIGGYPVCVVCLQSLAEWAALEYSKPAVVRELKEFLCDCVGFKKKMVIRAGFNKKDLREGVFSLLEEIARVSKALIENDKETIEWLENVVSDSVKSPKDEEANS